ncbi:MAG: FAD-dependent oxidoreductase, partial [Sulfurovum sp.]
MSTLKNNAKIAIIGGGVSGVTTALYLSHLGFHVTLFEQEKSLVCGPPFCHLHAGGNLYPDISDAQCVTLLKQSIDFLRFYPHVVDYRPTVIALPTYCTNHTANLLPRLKLLQKTYAKLIEKDEANEVLGKSEEYFKLYSHDTLKNLSKKTTPQQPQSADDWMIPVAKEITYDKVQFPLILVQEYGLNLFRLAASASLALDTLDNVTLHYQSKVTD